jgi:hypothetical protein
MYLPMSACWRTRVCSAHPTRECTFQRNKHRARSKAIFATSDDTHYPYTSLWYKASPIVITETAVPSPSLKPPSRRAPRGTRARAALPPPRRWHLCATSASGAHAATCARGRARTVQRRLVAGQDARHVLVLGCVRGALSVPRGREHLLRMALRLGPHAVV